MLNEEKIKIMNKLAMYEQGEGKKYLPVSIEAHHGLVDGFHLAKYLSEFQRQLDKE